MRNVIRLEGGQARVIEDQWVLPSDQAPATPRTLVRFADWDAARASAPAGAELALLLPNDIDPGTLAPFDPRLVLIAIEFPKATDGRGYSIATLLRRAGFRGELRAVGDVLRDQLAYLRRVGFDGFAIRADRDAAAAIPGLFDFSDAYQASIATPEPAFRRHPAGFDAAGA